MLTKGAPYFAFVAATLVCASSCGGSADQEEPPMPRGASGAIAEASRRDVLLDPDLPVWSEAAPDTLLARFETSAGDLVIEVVRGWAPIGADRFYNLVRLGYYDDVRFHRTVPDFIVQRVA